MPNRAVAVFLTAICGLSGPLGCERTGPVVAGSGARTVFVSIQAQALVVERVGGRFVRVQVLVGPGQSAHTFEPSPKQVAKLSDGGLFFSIGFPFEDQLLSKIKCAAGELAIIDMALGVQRRGVRAREVVQEHGDDDHDHLLGAADPHVWLAPRWLTIEAANVRDGLARFLPEHADEFRSNFEAFRGQMDELDRALADRLGALKGREFFVFHPAFGYFADAYGLTQVAIENDGKEPTARGLARVIEQARAARPGLILIEPQYSRRTADEIAREVGARVELVDPYAYDVPATLHRLAEMIVASNSESRP